MDHYAKKEAKGNFKGVCIVILTVCAVIAVLIYLVYLFVHAGDGARRLETANYWKYISDHKCTRTGFAGKNATPTYQCDNGLWLSNEINSLANPRESK